MKRSIVLVAVLVMLAVMVSSVSANVVPQEPTVPNTVASGAVTPDNVVTQPPITQIVVTNGEVTPDNVVPQPPVTQTVVTNGTVGSDDVVIDPPADPDSKATPILM